MAGGRECFPRFKRTPGNGGEVRDNAAKGGGRLFFDSRAVRNERIPVPGDQEDVAGRPGGLEDDGTGAVDLVSIETLLTELELNRSQ